MGAETIGPEHFSVAVHFARLATDHLARRGLAVPALLSRAGLGSTALDDPNGRIPFEAFDRICVVGSELLKDPRLGLKIGQSVRAGHLGSHGFALASCSSVEELIRQHTRYSVLTLDAAHVTFERNGTELVRLWRSNLPGGASLGVLQDELNAAVTVSLTRWLVSRDDLNPLWLSFRHAKPEDTRAYDALFRCPVRFEADETAIAIDARLASLPLPQANPQLRRVMGDLCAQLVERLGDSLEPRWLSVARRAILDSFEHGAPEIDAIATAAGVSGDELRELLAQRGSSFRALVDELRHALALGYARDPSLSIVDVAYLLGFSEQSAFQRAFKRWTGQTPGEFRRAK